MKKIYLVSLCLFFYCITLHATVHEINVADFQFTPSTLNVVVGDTVRWTWSSGASAHTSTSTTIPAGATAWNRAINSSTPVFDYKVTAPGTYNYHCTIHTTMIGSFVATGNAAVNNYNDPGFNFILNSNLVKDAIQITINLNRSNQVHLQLYDVTGALVRELNNANYSPGIYSETYAVADIRKGIYLLKLETGNNSVVKKIVIE